MNAFYPDLSIESFINQHNLADFISQVEVRKERAFDMTC